MTEDPRSKLGRGLYALFEETSRRRPGRPPPAPGGRGEAPVGDLAPARSAARDLRGRRDGGLIDSVGERGVIQPLIVRADPDEAGRYQIVAGERRWRAAQAAGLHEVPVVIQELSDAAALEVALIENIQRQDLTPVEEAEGYRRLTEEFDRTQDELLARARQEPEPHRQRAPPSSTCRDAIKLLLNQGGDLGRHGRALLKRARDPVAVAVEVMRRNLTVRETRAADRR